MEDAESVKVLLDIIFDQNTEVKYPPQTEKEQRTATKKSRNSLGCVCNG